MISALVAVEMLDGWGAVARRVESSSGVPFSVDQAQRAAQRRHDPLPVKRVNRLRRRRIVAKARDVDAWAAREFMAP